MYWWDIAIVVLNSLLAMYDETVLLKMDQWPQACDSALYIAPINRWTYDLGIHATLGLQCFTKKNVAAHTSHNTARSEDSQYKHALCNSLVQISASTLHNMAPLASRQRSRSPVRFRNLNSTGYIRMGWEQLVRHCDGNGDVAMEVAKTSKRVAADTWIVMIKTKRVEAFQPGHREWNSPF